VNTTAGMRIATRRSGAGAGMRPWKLADLPARMAPPRTARLRPTETWSLIASDKVEDTAVYDGGGEKLGSVYNFMVNKRSGYVAYAVMSFGGWLGMGAKYHPLPWSTLTYDTDLGGYRVGVSKDRLRNAPSYEAGHDVSSDESYLRRLKEYWA